MAIRTNDEPWVLDEQSSRDGVELLARSQFVEAQRILEGVLDDRRRCLGHNHPDTVDTMVFLASALEGQRRLGTARALLEPALKRLRVLVGTRHWKAQLVMCDLASIYLRQGKSARAKRLVGELVVQSEALSHGLLDHHIGDRMHALAKRLIEAGEVDASRALLEAAAEAGARTGNQLCRLSSLLSLAEMLIPRAELDRAHELIRELIAVGHAVPGWDAVDVIMVATMLLDGLATSDEPHHWERIAALSADIDEMWASVMEVPHQRPATPPATERNPALDSFETLAAR